MFWNLASRVKDKNPMLYLFNCLSNQAGEYRRIKTTKAFNFFLLIFLTEPSTLFKKSWYTSKEKITLAYKIFPIINLNAGSYFCN